MHLYKQNWWVGSHVRPHVSFSKPRKDFMGEGVVLIRPLEPMANPQTELTELLKTRLTVKIDICSKIRKSSTSTNFIW